MKVTVFNKITKGLLASALLCTFSGVVISQETEESLDPVYECTAEETVVYINKATYGIYAPSPIQSPKKFKKGWVEQKMQEEDGGCVTIFTDGSLNESWKEIVDTIRSFDMNVSVSAADLAAVMAMAKKIVQEELTTAMEALGSDICKFLSTENMEKLALGAINDKLGINAKSLAIKDLANEVQELAYDSADDDIQTLLSKDKMAKEIRRESRKEFKKVRKELWDNL